MKILLASDLDRMHHTGCEQSHDRVAVEAAWVARWWADNGDGDEQLEIAAWAKGDMIKFVIYMVGDERPLPLSLAVEMFNSIVVTGRFTFADYSDCVALASAISDFIGMAQIYTIAEAVKCQNA